MKFKIKNIGRISSAIIEPKKLTIFLGKNDSGKTYAAASIWSVLSSIKKYRLKDKAVSEIIKEVATEAERDEHCLEREIPIELLKKVQRSLQRHITQSLSRDLTDAIGYDGFSSSSVQVEAANSESIYVSLKIIKDSNRFSSRGQAVIKALKGMEKAFAETEISIRRGDNVVFERTSLVPVGFCRDSAVDSLKSIISGYAFLGDDFSVFGNIVYIPAARTGIMIALDYFINGALKRADLTPDETLESSQNLPAPIRDFAIRVSMRRSPADLGGSGIMQNIIKGKLSSGARRGEFLYTPENTTDAIPLASTSSLVTELAAFPAVVEKQIRHGAFLIFEEPEAHLHLEAQRDMAKAIANIVNRTKTRVLITSHSDTFIQQINNLIAVSDHPDREILQRDLSLSDSDLISRSSVCAYDFACVDGVTNPVELELTKTGFVAKSLNDVLERLFNETMRINEGLIE